MKIAAVQLQSIKGDIAENIDRHLQWIAHAIGQEASLVFFPELSLTGYEPKLARELAADVADRRFDVFQAVSDERGVVIGVGLPVGAQPKPHIGMLWFAPFHPRACYAKQQLHVDELAWFSAGNTQAMLHVEGNMIAPAICFESLQPDHAAHAVGLGAQIYLASVAKPAGGIIKGMRHYPAIASKHAMMVILANAVGPNDDFNSVGASAAWTRHGELLAQMDNASEGMLVVDTALEAARITTFCSAS